MKTTLIDRYAAREEVRSAYGKIARNEEDSKGFQLDRSS